MIFLHHLATFASVCMHEHTSILINVTMRPKIISNKYNTKNFNNVNGILFFIMHTISSRRMNYDT